MEAPEVGDGISPVQDMRSPVCENLHNIMGPRYAPVCVWWSTRNMPDFVTSLFFFFYFTFRKVIRFVLLTFLTTLSYLPQQCTVRARIQRSRVYLSGFRLNILEATHFRKRTCFLLHMKRRGSHEQLRDVIWVQYKELDPVKAIKPHGRLDV